MSNKMENSPEKKSKLAEILAMLKGKAQAVTGADNPEEFYQNFRGAAKEGIEEDVFPAVQKHMGDDAAVVAGTGLETALDYVAPEDPKELAMAALPMGKLGRGLSKEARAAALAEREAAPVGTAMMNYGAMKAEDKAAMAAARKASEEAAPTIVYGKGGPKRFTAEELKKLKPE